MYQKDQHSDGLRHRYKQKLQTTKHDEAAQLSHPRGLKDPFVGLLTKASPGPVAMYYCSGLRRVVGQHV